MLGPCSHRGANTQPQPLHAVMQLRHSLEQRVFRGVAMQQRGPTSHPFCKAKLLAQLSGVLVLNALQRANEGSAVPSGMHRVAAGGVNLLMNLSGALNLTPVPCLLCQVVETESNARDKHGHPLRRSRSLVFKQVSPPWAHNPSASTEQG